MQSQQQQQQQHHQQQHQFDMTMMSCWGHPSNNGVNGMSRKRKFPTGSAQPLPPPPSVISGDIYHSNNEDDSYRQQQQQAAVARMMMKRSRTSKKRVQFQVDPNNQEQVLHTVIPSNPITSSFVSPAFLAKTLLKPAPQDDNMMSKSTSKTISSNMFQQHTMLALQDLVALNQKNQNRQERMLERQRAIASLRNASPLYKEVLALTYLSCCSTGNQEIQAQQEQEDGSPGDDLIPTCLENEHLTCLGLGAGETRGLEIHLLPMMGQDRLRRRKLHIRKVIDLSSTMRKLLSTQGDSSSTNDQDSSLQHSTAESLVRNASLELTRSARSFAQTFGAADAIAALSIHAEDQQQSHSQEQPSQVLPSTAHIESVITAATAMTSTATSSPLFSATTVPPQTQSPSIVTPPSSNTDLVSLKKQRRASMVVGMTA